MLNLAQYNYSCITQRTKMKEWTAKYKNHGSTVVCKIYDVMQALQ